DFAAHRDLLDRALYPSTFTETLAELREIHLTQYERTYLIQTQGTRITELEGRIAFLTRRLDTLAAGRDSLFAKLQGVQGSTASFRQTSRRLSASLRARDRLIFALMDSIFLSYRKDSDLQKESLSRRIEQADALDRVYDIALDNVRFLKLTRLEPQDYADVIALYEQFNGRWAGLRDKIVDVSASTRDLSRKKTEADLEKNVAAPVDSVLTVWKEELHGLFWSEILTEFTTRDIQIGSFSTGREFSERIEAYVEDVRARDEDAGVFVNDVWKLRIDREWREALTTDVMLGRAEYARLDSLVSGLAQKRFDEEFILYSALLLLLVIAIWWFFVRSPKRPAVSRTKEEKSETGNAAPKALPNSRESP
ncbi:MAG: hypothetical protein KAJ12_13280, partial [Bacteroidetes bacterium]|nr:hypothetical protein [Bacteroidota bacterium]